MGVQRFASVSPLVDDELNEFVECDVVTFFRGNGGGILTIFAYNLFADHRVKYRVVTGQFILIGRDEPFERMPDEKEFRVVITDDESVVEMFGVQRSHWIAIVNFSFWNGRQVGRVDDGTREDQHEPLQIRTGHLMGYS